MIDRAKHVQEIMEGFYIIQQKMLAKKNPIAGISHVTFSQWRVLEIVSRQASATIKEIHTILGITSSAATQLVNELVKKKYVVRNADPHDKRVSSISLTPKTKDLLNKLKAMNIQNMIMMFNSLDNKEFEQYIHLNKKIINTISHGKN
jgi:DNA-binding MarR family transcriptional regulator